MEVEIRFSCLCLKNRLHKIIKNKERKVANLQRVDVVFRSKKTIKITTIQKIQKYLKQKDIGTS